ncbi:GtrA family protein [Novosphingobium sp.]|uniref:GtrA family protein n=1 Tax=Novosphingobium sp. TaxID=1874826 RepID=UPI002B4949A5|nr:GtrA family protein [Novosphingobium sp.]HKR92895.1 GtrA family protein [Novosphingobium sp.]
MLQSAIRFGLVGIANTLIGLAVIAALLRAGAGDYLANTLSYAVGLCASFLLNRAWTFGVRGPVIAGEVQRFIAAFALSYAANLAMLTLMRGYGFAQSLIGQGAAMAVYSACFFLLTRRFVFRAGTHAA